MVKVIVFGAAAAAALLAGSARAAPAQAPQSWVITPGDDSCRADIDLVGHLGVVAQVSLVSDGSRIELRYAKDDVPQRAFLPIRIDQRPYSNLMQRMENPRQGAMVLSEETVEALRRGKVLQVAWLAEEPVSAMLGGSEQGIIDLKTCGAEVSAQWKAQLAARDEARSREETQTRAQAVADAQLAAAKAAREASEATKRRETAEADRLRQQQQVQAEADAERQRAAYDAQRARQYYPYSYRDAYGRTVTVVPPWSRQPQSYYPPDED